jgi:hypothetical protein
MHSSIKACRRTTRSGDRRWFSACCACFHARWPSARWLRPASVATTERLRASSPGPSVIQPAAISGCMFRVSVDASSRIACARSVGRIGPRRTTYESSEYCVPLSPVGAT